MPESRSATVTVFNARFEQISPIPLAAKITCHAGELLALVGPSGSGKSTLLRSIAGLYRPAHGHIICNGESWLDTTAGICLPIARRRIGMVFQNYALFPHLSALENVLEGMDAPTAADSRERAMELLRRVHLDGLAGRRPAQLSGGQQQRVAMARALARNPHILLLDEPFSAVDRATREKLYSELAELRRTLSMPILLVTHDLDEATLLADRITILSRGRTLQSAAPETVFRQPVDAEVARLVGMKNLFPGKILAHQPDAGYTLVDWNGQILKVALRQDLSPGTMITWGIPTSDVLLLPLDHHASGLLDNLVTGKISGLVPLGTSVHIQIQAQMAGLPRLFLSVSRHIARRYDLHEGDTLTLRLHGEHIHLMAATTLGKPQVGELR